MIFDVSHPEVRQAVRRALEEDIGTGDITTNLCVPADRKAVAEMIARQRMVVAGIELLPLIVGSNVSIHAPSGTLVEPDTTIATIHGPAEFDDAIGFYLPEKV